VAKASGEQRLDLGAAGIELDLVVEERFERNPVRPPRRAVVVRPRCAAAPKRPSIVPSFTCLLTN
jgi:hypothetical protein